MASLDLIVQAGTLATQTSLITGDVDSAVQAAGYGAWITAVTGSMPVIRQIGTEKRAQMILTESQKLSMRGWLNNQVGGLLAPQTEKPKLDVALGDTLTPWALQYAVPAIIGAMVLGWIGHWIIMK